jgi:hypothetical protein
MPKKIIETDVIKDVCKKYNVSDGLLKSIVAIERNVSSTKERKVRIHELLERAAKEEFGK